MGPFIYAFIYIYIIYTHTYSKQTFRYAILLQKFGAPCTQRQTWGDEKKKYIYVKENIILAFKIYFERMC